MRPLFLKSWFGAWRWKLTQSTYIQCKIKNHPYKIYEGKEISYSYVKRVSFICQQICNNNDSCSKTINRIESLQHLNEDAADKGLTASSRITTDIDGWNGQPRQDSKMEQMTKGIKVKTHKFHICHALKYLKSETLEYYNL